MLSKDERRLVRQWCFAWSKYQEIGATFEIYQGSTVEHLLDRWSNRIYQLWHQLDSAGVDPFEYSWQRTVEVGIASDPDRRIQYCVNVPKLDEFAPPAPLRGLTENDPWI